MELLASPGVLSGEKALKRMPSKRTRASWVASQRYPSGVWAMEETVFWGSPCSVCQESSRK